MITHRQPALPDVEADAMWRLSHGQRLRQHSWGDESVLYNDLSGDTHLLDDAAIAVLRALQASAQDGAALVALLCAQFEAEPDVSAARETADLLASLSALALIERVAC